MNQNFFYLLHNSEKSSTFAAMFAKGRYIGWLLGALCMMGQGCSSSAVQEAEHVVAQADSLRAQGRMYGIDEGDSITLAQAYETLQKKSHLSIINYQLSSSYARACYHYGRLLREKDDPVAAMQVFINATHSRTRDYHILGRIYSNMGSICHLAGEYSLSYDMFERSGEMYLLAQDTLLYYYDLNNMAFELAEQGKKDETQVLLSHIEKHSSIKDLIAKTWETKAVACKKVEQYDSTIYYTSLSMKNGYYSSTILLNRAQAYSYMGSKDSAVYYANMVLNRSNKISHINNALYILTNDIQTDKVESIRQTAADRSDVQFLLAARQGELTQAVQLLEQDMTRIPDDLRIIIASIVLLIIIMSVSIVYYSINHKREQIKRSLLSQQEQQRHLDRQHADFLQKRRKDLEWNCAMLRNSKYLKAELDWEHYDSMCANVNTRLYGIADKLQNKQEITANDVRLCVLVLIELSYDEIANILNLSPKSIAKLKSLAAHKLGATMKNMRENLVQMACQDSVK